MEIILIVFFFIKIVSPNLLCNGDFENYTLNGTYNGDPYVFKASDPNCWYNKNNGIIQIKNKLNPLTTSAAELTSIQPYTLCQKINLVPGRDYMLQYSLLCPPKLSQMLLSVKLNQVKISTLQIINQNTFGTNSVIVTPSQIISQFCFSETHVASIFDAFDGGFLDNITLTEIISSQTPIITANQTVNSSVVQQNNSSLPEQNNFGTQIILPDASSHYTNDFMIQQRQERFKVIVHLKTQVKELAWEIHLVSDILFQNYLKYSLLERISIFSIFLEGQLQKQSYSKQNQEGMAVIIIKIHRNYDINTLEVIAQNTQNAEQFVDFQVYLDNKRIHFHLMNQNQKKVVQTFQPVSYIMPEVVFKMYEIISSSLCSYFVLSLFNFWNLSLMYNFLLVDNVPNFTRNIYEIMINLLYQKGSVIEWLTKNFDISEDAFDLMEWENLPEKMQDYKEGFSWFGVFGFSSIALINNLDTLFILALLVFKLALLKIIIQCISKKIQNTLELPKRLSPFFMLQLIAAVPFILISSVVAVSCSAESPRQLTQKFLQTFLLFGCVCIVPLWFVINFQNIKDIRIDLHKLKEYQKLDHSERLKWKISSKIKSLCIELKSENFSLNYNLTELILNVTVPGLIWLGNTEGFLIVNTLVIAGRSIYFYKNMKRMNILDRTFSFTMTLIWLIHHFDYCIFFILSTLRQNSIVDKDKISELEVYCGIVAFLTVLIGGGIEILRFLCQIIMMVLKIIKKIKQLCKLRKKQKQIQPKFDRQSAQMSSFHPKIQNSVAEQIVGSRLEEDEGNIWYIPIKIIKRKNQPLKNEQEDRNQSISSSSNDNVSNQKVKINKQFRQKNKI